MRTDLLLHHLIVPPLAALLISNSVGQDSHVLLNSRDPIQRQIARGDEHRYRIALAAGEFASIVVEQKGIDVGVLVRDESNAIIEEFQDEIRRAGQERVEIVAEKAGSFVLSIKPADGTTAQGDYLIRLEEKRPASDAERRMQESRVLRTRARQLERTGKYAEARSLFEQSLAGVESVRGCDDAYVGLIAFD